MSTGRVRGLAICLCRQDDRILVGEYFDRVKAETFYRPLGGSIEFGERGEQAVRREFREEIGAELHDLRWIGTLENIYVCEGIPGHEIVLVFDGRLAEADLYRAASIPVDENGQSMRAVWRALAEFTPGAPPLYPDGLLELLTRPPAGDASGRD